MIQISTGFIILIIGSILLFTVFALFGNVFADLGIFNGDTDTETEENYILLDLSDNTKMNVRFYSHTLNRIVTSYTTRITRPSRESYIQHKLRSEQINQTQFNKALTQIALYYTV